MKVIIVGGVAGGASCAARLRRLDEQAEIVMVERGPYVSFANCGLPYHVGGVIEHESDLLVASPQVFRGHFRVDCRTGCEAIGISPSEKTVQLRDVASSEVSTESYDKLVLSPGAASIRPPLPGIDLPGIFPVRTVPDAREIREWIERGTSFLTGMGKYSGFQTMRPPMRAVVIGGGFIGLETAENLVFRGFDVSVVEMADQVLTPLDPEYGRLVGDFLEQHGVHVALGDGVAGFEQSEDDTLTVSTQSGKRYPADVVILALGVRPDTTLARMAGIEVGELGGIRVDEQMRTSDPDIFAVGDAVEVRDFVTGEWSLIALAGPANRQARIAAEVIVGRDSRFRGTQGTAVVGLFGSTVAWTGANEKTLQRLGDSGVVGSAAFIDARDLIAARPVDRAGDRLLRTDRCNVVRSRSRGPRSPSVARDGVGGRRVPAPRLADRARPRVEVDQLIARARAELANIHTANCGGFIPMSAPGNAR